MPILDVKTTLSEQVWTSPDGQRKIYKVTLEFEGKPVQAKTYSDAIAQIGWEGTVETYEKEGRNGSETFVKQPPKENNQNYTASSSTSGGAGRTNKPSFDNYTMYLSYAKDLAVALVGTKEGFDGEKYADLLDSVIAGGDVLYAGRPDAPKKETEDAPMPENFGKKEDSIVEVTDDPVDLSTINDVFKK
jgi:hypothetical protein